MDHEMSMKEFLYYRYKININELKEPILFSSIISLFTLFMFYSEHIKMYPLIIVTAITAYFIYDLQKKCKNEYLQKINYLQLRLNNIKNNLYKTNKDI
jgi:hypothetical protein